MSEIEEEYTSKESNDFIADVLSKLYLQNGKDTVFITRQLVATFIMIMKEMEGVDFTNDFVKAALEDNMILKKAKLTEH